MKTIEVSPPLATVVACGSGCLTALHSLGIPPYTTTKTPKIEVGRVLKTLGFAPIDRIQVFVPK